MDIAALFFQSPVNGVTYIAEGVSDFEYVIDTEISAAKKVELSWLTLLIREKLTVTMEGQAKNILLTVFDINGKEYIRERIEAFDGLYYKTLDLQNVAKGTLIVNVRHKGKDYQKKVIVQ